MKKPMRNDYDLLFQNNDAIGIITDTFKCNKDDIREVKALKKGMTNNSFAFDVRGQKYLVRVPGEGTAKLINRYQEKQVYDTIKGMGICDDPLYLNPENGFKITGYLRNVRTSDPYDHEDVMKCIQKLKEFHGMDLKVSHHFDLFYMIEYYESLWGGTKSIHSDYSSVRSNVMSLKRYIDGMDVHKCLSHIDAVPDNFLFFTDVNGIEKLQLTDWEYSGMQDPHVDLAMFCIYSMYEKSDIDELIDIYFDGNCNESTRTKIYCYISICGLIWSNWCEYKRMMGVEFGSYAESQYEYSRRYYDMVKNMAL